MIRIYFLVFSSAALVFFTSSNFFSASFFSATSHGTLIVGFPTGLSLKKVALHNLLMMPELRMRAGEDSKSSFNMP